MDNSFPKENQITQGLEKCPTGIKGLDEVLFGGLPRGRTTLICGEPGCGKTLLAGEFLARGVEAYGEAGVFMAFEETQEELTQNLASLGMDLNDLMEQGKIFIDHVHLERSEIEETGAYDLDGLFIRLADAIDTVGAKRVVLDTIETIFAGLSNEGILRAELRRLFRWLKEREVTAIVTAERGERALTRHGLEEYVSDCVILLDQRVRDGLATRRLRVVKYRGSRHGGDEYPFLIDQQGIWVMPVTSVGFEYPVFKEYISTGIQDMDAMLGGNGYYRGSSILVSGSPGAGKTSLMAHLLNAACMRGERCLFFSYEESANQIVRNMASIGIYLEQWIEKDLLHFHNVRPSFYGAEMHLLSSTRVTDAFQPSVIAIDTLNNLSQVATTIEVKSLMVRMIDHFKMKGITAIYSYLTPAEMPVESSDIGISSLMDVWVLLSNREINGERKRSLSVLKSRGMAHSEQILEFWITNEGLRLVQPGSAGETHDVDNQRTGANQGDRV